MTLEILILDTNIVSYVMNGHSLAAEYRPHFEGKRLAISFMTVAELYEGAYRGAWNDMKLARLDREIRKYLVIPYSMRLAQEWAKIRAERRLQPIAVDDAWIAAAALGLDCPLLTHNPGDFHGIAGLKIITEHTA